MNRVINDGLAARHAAELAEFLQARRLAQQHIMDSAWGDILRALPPPVIPASVNTCLSDDDDDESADGAGGPPGGGCRTRSPTPIEDSAQSSNPPAHLDASSEDSIRRRASNSGAVGNVNDMRSFFQQAYSSGDDAAHGNGRDHHTSSSAEEGAAEQLTKEQLIARFKELYNPDV